MKQAILAVHAILTRADELLSLAIPEIIEARAAIDAACERLLTLSADIEKTERN